MEILAESNSLNIKHSPSDKITLMTNKVTLHWKINIAVTALLLAMTKEVTERFISLCLEHTPSALIILFFSRSHVIPAQGLVVLFSSELRGAGDQEGAARWL